MPDLYEIARRYQQRMVRAGDQVRREVAELFEGALGEIVNRIDRLIPLGDLAALYARERLTRLQGEIERELARVADRSAVLVGLATRDFASQGGEDAARIVAAGSRLPRARAMAAIGLTAQDGPVYELFARLAPAGAGRARQAIFNAVALGYDLRRTRAAMAEALSITRTRAELIARTETLRAYREGARACYRELGIQRYRWLSARQTRTCALCWALDGREFAVSRPFYTHPNCRCTMVPVLGKERVETGEELFAALSDDAQLAILGPKKFELYKSGELRLTDLVGERTHEKWGIVPYERSVWELENLRRRRL